ncbi:hypothetical protein UlMin_031316 [Ulmus minor]
MEFDNAAEDTSVGGSLLPLAAASQQPYVSEILSFTLDRLHKLLCVHTEWIRRQMQEVAVGNYRAFIAAADALLAIREEVSSIDKHLESLILEKRKMNQTLLANHSTLFDLLEIPQLMDTCVRNGNFDEALNLEAFVGKLSTMHPKLPVIQALATEVRQTTQSILSQLLLKLRSNIQLPECLRIIGYLHRIGVFSEYEMRLQSWLIGILEDLDQINAYEYLKGMINCHQMHLFVVVNQYRAIFVDDTSRSEENYDGGLLFSWAMHHITSHLMIKGYSFQECFLSCNFKCLIMCQNVFVTVEKLQHFYTHILLSNPPSSLVNSSIQIGLNPLESLQEQFVLDSYIHSRRESTLYLLISHFSLSVCVIGSLMVIYETILQMMNLILRMLSREPFLGLEMTFVNPEKIRTFNHILLPLIGDNYWNFFM